MSGDIIKLIKATSPIVASFIDKLASAIASSSTTEGVRKQIEVSLNPQLFSSKAVQNNPSIYRRLRTVLKRAGVIFQPSEIRTNDHVGITLINTLYPRRAAKRRYLYREIHKAMPPGRSNKGRRFKSILPAT